MTNPHISFEFFPPKTEQGKENLHATRVALEKYNPEFYSVTYGAGGTTRTTTRNIVVAIQESGVQAAPHLSFGGDSEEDVLALLEDYKANGIRNLVALRGDLPSGMGGGMQLVYANELVAFIKKHFGDHFAINVAAYPEVHPEAESLSKDIFWLGEKFRAGADRAITQYFYNADAYFRFMDNCQKAGIHKPILPGIMPLTNYENIVRFSRTCGADIPRWLRWQLKELSVNKEALVEFGIEVVSDLCRRLIEGGAPGLHFYTMNQTYATSRICDNLNL